MHEPWTLTDVLILAAVFTEYDLQNFYVRRVLKRVELGELRPREAVQLLQRQYEQSGDPA